MMCDTAAIAINCIYYYLIGPTQAHPSTAWPFDYQHTLYYEISRSNGQLTLVYNSFCLLSLAFFRIFLL